MYYRYFSCGSRSEKEGLTLVVTAYYDDGMLCSGHPQPEKLYKAKELTKEEYDDIRREIKNSSTRFGLSGGIINDKGLEEMRKELAKMRKEDIESALPQINLSVKKIKKQLELGIIEQSDIDVEIEQQGMMKFADEIKKRLNQ